MQPTYTPGPWHITETEPGIDADMDVWTTTPRYAGGKGLIARVIEADDARLIAAAPEMLDALQALETMALRTAKAFPNAPGVGDWKQAALVARAALAKASE